MRRFLPRGRLTIRARMALTVAVACTLAVLLVAGGLYLAVSRFLLVAQFERLSSIVTLARDRIERGLSFGRLDLELLGRDVLPADVNVRVSVGRQTLAVTQTFPETLARALPPGDYQLGGSFVLVRPLDVPGGVGQLTLVTGRRSFDEARAAYLRALTVLLPMVLVLVVVVAWLTAGRLLRPIGALERTARAIGESGDLTRPIPEAGDHDELARLAATLERTFGQLARTREREQQFLRSAAHDLRGPLTALRTRVALSLTRERDVDRYRNDLREIGTDLERLSRLAGHLLVLARNPETVARNEFDLFDAAAGVVDAEREAHPDRWIDLDGARGVRVLGDRVLVEQAVANLVRNAVRHAPRSAVSVTVGREGSRGLVRVSDEGPGVDPRVLARLGEAFFRPDEARSGDGHGLGLAIVRHVATLHGGSVELDARPGEGFQVRLWLPVATVSSPAE